VGGHQDDGRRLRPGADRVEQVQPVGIRQVVVQQDDLRLGGRAERLASGPDVDALAEPVRPDYLERQASDRVVVVDDQDATAAGGGQSCASSRNTSAWRRDTTASSAS
jgi:hypothetical protein